MRNHWCHKANRSLRFMCFDIGNFLFYFVVVSHCGNNLVTSQCSCDVIKHKGELMVSVVLDTRAGVS